MNKVAVVTGASSGIGEATVRHLCREGWDVVAAARRVDRLQALSTETGAQPVELDVTSDASVSALAQSVPRCDLLVNNAGIALGMDRIEDASAEDWHQMFEVNVVGAMRVTKAMLPQLRAAVQSTVIMVTSTAGHVTYEGGAGYTASKHAQHALVETLRLELLGEQIRVIEIAPGMVKTYEFSLKRFDGDQARADAVYAGVPDPLTAQDVASCIWLATSLPHHVNIDSLVVRGLAQAAQHALHTGPWKS